MAEQPAFNTVQYCMDNNIPCFTFPFHSSKKISVAWSDITPANFKDHIHPEHNGFAIITGYTHLVIDFDEKKHNPPAHIKDALFHSCHAVEETPGGYHFWFTIDPRTAEMKSRANISWDNQPIIGLDSRGLKGICYTAPSYYDLGGVRKEYRWSKGDLSTATNLPDDVYRHLWGIEAPKEDEEAETKEEMDVRIIPEIHFIGARVVHTTFMNKRSIQVIPVTKGCIVSYGHIHSETNHTCVYLTKSKAGYCATACCFSHGTRKMAPEMCKMLVKEFWPHEEEKKEETKQYEQMKAVFEENNFKVLHPVGFYTRIHNIWYPRDRKQMKTSYENLLLDDESPFIDRWLKDKTMRTYTEVSMQPSPHPSVFVFPDPPLPSFVYQSYTCEPRQDAIPMFNELIDLLSNHKQELRDYLIKYCAHMIQRPHEQPGTALIFVGQKGVGKDTIGDLIGTHIVGDTYFQNYSNQLQFFEKHDVLRATKIMVKVEELSKKIFMDETNDNLFKAAITSPNITINPKNDKPYNVKNYARIFGTTNHASAVNVEQRERRYVFFVVSPEKRGDHAYWTHLRSVLFTPAGALAVARMLEQVDLTGFQPQILPKDTYLGDLQETSVDSVQRFIEQVAPHEYGASQLYRDYKIFCTTEDLFPYSNTKFATQLVYLAENGSITKKSVVRNRKAQGVVYTIKNTKSTETTESIE
jgi:hypothetical protein